MNLWGTSFWDYSKSEYKGMNNKIKIICVKHNHLFEQLASAHLKKKNGCFYCVSNKMDTKKFIEKSKSIWKDKYNYDMVNYIDRKTPITLVCNEHNHIFEQEIGSHFRKNKGCKFCSNVKSDTSKFIEKSKSIWKDFWDYSMVNYLGSNESVTLICKKHNHIFEQKVSNHLRGANNCKYCNSKSTDDFIEESKAVWGEKFDYSLVEYKKSNITIKLICKQHNYLFEQKPYLNLQKQCGCKICNSYTTEDFIKKANVVHNNLYDYSLTRYIKSNQKVEIRCITHDYVFKQVANNHLKGNGCPICNTSQGEKMIKKILDYLKIDCVQQMKFDDCKDIGNLMFDFYIPKYNKCIEFDGIQHFKSVDAFGGVTGLESIKRRDNIKNLYCRDNNIGLLRINYKEKQYVKTLLKIINFLEK